MANEGSWHTLAINLQTARAIGIKVTSSPLLAPADEVLVDDLVGIERSKPGRPSCSARTRCNIVDPVALHRFVSPKIHRNRHRRRPPYKLLPEFDFEPGFLLPQENDFEGPGRRRAARRIDQHDRRPFPLHGWTVHL